MCVCGCYLLQMMEIATRDTRKTAPAAAEPAIRGSCSLNSDLYSSEHTHTQPHTPHTHHTHTTGRKMKQEDLWPLKFIAVQHTHTHTHTLIQTHTHTHGQLRRTICEGLEVHLAAVFAKASHGPGPNLHHVHGPRPQSLQTHRAGLATHHRRVPLTGVLEWGGGGGATGERQGRGG